MELFATGRSRLVPSVSPRLHERQALKLATSPQGVNSHRQTATANCGPVFLTLPTALPTGQTFSALSEHALSSASNSSSVAASSPSHFGQSLSARMAGILLCSSAIMSLGAHV